MRKFSINQAMSFFKTIANFHEPHALAGHVGSPAKDEEHFFKRMAFFSSLRHGNGFRLPKDELRKDLAGKTRGQYKREAYERFKAAYKANPLNGNVA